MDEELKKVALFAAKKFLEANGYYVSRKGEMLMMDGIRKIEYEPFTYSSGGTTPYDPATGNAEWNTV